MTLAALRVRYGPEAVRGATELGAEGLPTGLGAIDSITPCGGLPRGRLTWLSGEAGQGGFDLGLVLLALASRSLPVALVDFHGRVDPGDIAAYGGDLGNCWLVRPRQPEEGWAAARALCEAGVELCLMVATGWEPVGKAAPTTLLGALEAGRGVGLLSGGVGLPAAVSTRVALELGCRRQGWTRAHRDVSGLWLRLEVIRSRLGGVGRACQLRIALPRPYALGLGVAESAWSPPERLEASG